MLDDHAHAMQVKLCKANTQGVTKDKREIKNKRIFLCGAGISNTVVQRTVNGHTTYMTRDRTKFGMNGEISEHWSASKRERL